MDKTKFKLYKIKKMKNFTHSFLIVGLIMYLTSCTKDFAEINTNPQVMTDPKPEYLFTYTCEAIPDGTSAWLYEDFEQYMRWAQLVTTENYEPNSAGNISLHSRYNSLYTEILPNLHEVRRLIETYTNQDQYMVMWAASYVLEVYSTLRVTDVFGSIPYTEAMQWGNGKYDPVYDNQSTLFDKFYEQLTEASRILQDQAIPDNQAWTLTSDLFYSGIRTKWSRLANSLLLRLATRYEGQNKDKTIAIFKQVMQDPTGIMTSIADEFLFYKPTDFNPAGETDYRSAKYAARNVVDFMKKTGDIRLAMYYDPNGLSGDFRDTLVKYNKVGDLPDFIDLNDPLVMYQGGVVNWTDPDSKWIKSPLDVSPWTKYALVSPINRKFFNVKKDGADDTFTDVFMGYAEVCFYIAEFIQKGYNSGFDAKGSAEDWYKKGVEASIRSMYAVSRRANSFPAMSDDDLTAAINAYLNTPEVKFDGTNDMDKIMIQQYLSLFRSGNEVFAFIRRTGYPKQNSTILKSDVLDGSIPRRLWTQEPTEEINKDHWREAYQQQGFSVENINSLTNLSSQRLWWDINAPDYGKGQ